VSVDAVVWHDLECGCYDADLELWLELAGAAAAAGDGPVLDVGAGTGRVALPLARAGHEIVALDRDPLLLAALRERAAGLPISYLEADACDFRVSRTFALCIVPMQTIHLLADPAAFLRCAHRCLRPGGVLAVALLGAGVEPFEVELDPETAVRDGVLYESWPTALRLDGATIVLERRRERTDAAGLRASTDVVRLTGLGPAELIAEAAAAGFAASGSRIVAPTDERAGSIVLLLEAVGARAPARSAAASASPGKST
jgi:SAM-dependent methyltransferase